MFAFRKIRELYYWFYLEVQQLEFILYASIALIAVAFTVLVVYLAKTLKSLRITLDQVAGTLAGLEKQVEGITKETTDLLHKTNQLAEDIQKKSEKVNSVVDAVKEIGTSIQQFNRSMKKVSASVTGQLEKNEEKVAQAIQWTNAVMELIDKVKQRKRSKKQPD